jgi:hypothetical protein
MKTPKPLVLLICFLVFSFNTVTAQTYDPYAVQVINNLIANGNVYAIPDAPDTWMFATWNDETPKQLIGLGFGYYPPHGPLHGDVSLSGLKTLQSLSCWENNLTQLDVSNCTQLQTLDCMYNFRLSELDVTNCSQLQKLKCGNMREYSDLTELDILNCTNLRYLDCSGNRLAKLDVTNCTQLQSLNCSENTDSRDWRNAMAPFFDELNVNIDIALQGHDHLYEVIGPVFNKDTVAGTVSNVKNVVSSYPANITGKSGGIFNVKKGTLYFTNGYSGWLAQWPNSFDSMPVPNVTGVPNYPSLFTGRYGKPTHPTYSHVAISSHDIVITTYEVDPATGRSSELDKITVVKYCEDGTLN